MRYVIVDVEATCWETGTRVERQEIIEIGAVLLADMEPVDEFARFIKPTNEPILSDFCKQLTSITQADVDAAAHYPDVFRAFVAWAGAEPFTLVSWGAYDLRQFRADCDKHGMTLPESFENHIHLKKQFARQRDIKPCGMARALQLAGIPLEGTHHRGIDDARNIAKIARLVLPGTP
ncbi:MAG: 3'-5' exonuclease [Chloroflexota bacterium]